MANKKFQKTLMYDERFKYFIKDPKYRWYTILLLAGILKLDKNYVEKNLYFLDTELTGNPNQTGKRSDTVFEVGNYIINVEMNQNKNYDFLEDKIRYVNYLYNKYFDGKHKRMDYTIIQVHINNFDCCEKEVEYVYLKNQKGIVTPKIKIIIYNLVKLKRKYYNNFTLSKLEKLLLVLKLSANMEKLKKFLEDDEFMRELEKEKKFFQDVMEGFAKEFDYDEELEGKRMAEIRTARIDGIEEGISQGSSRKQREMVAKMLNEKVPLDLISKISDMSITELEGMQKELSYS